MKEKLEDKVFEFMGSDKLDKACYNTFKFFGAAFFIAGFGNFVLWALASACFAGMLFMETK